ncbi:hypothetical protein NDU88_003248 [Pleurodeles waltl]|uniref:Uncharacterized protein n=1 Tax=Pleurodeles waltl TaxID=8319 RepID=A0AAV7UFK7_PLEWA|nr:hypothetical protein NDU88_003248 [Pleurodeles waltl]
MTLMFLFEGGTASRKSRLNCIRQPHGPRAGGSGGARARVFRKVPALALVGSPHFGREVPALRSAPQAGEVISASTAQPSGLVYRSSRAAARDVVWWLRLLDSRHPS